MRGKARKRFGLGVLGVTETDRVYQKLGFPSSQALANLVNLQACSFCLLFSAYR